MLSDTRGESEIGTAGEGGEYYTFHGLDEIVIRPLFTKYQREY
jgi:diphthamide synthase (EF-2-diphthine--ammonia ligase)